MSEGFDNGTSQFYGEPQKNNGNNGMAIASMVLGIVSIVVLCWRFPIGLICGIVSAILAIVLGIMHNKRNSKNGMAIAGIVCGIIGLVLAVILLALAALGLFAMGSLLAGM